VYFRLYFVLAIRRIATGVLCSLVWLDGINVAGAYEEVRLSQSMNLLSGSPSGVRLIMKVWENESDARNRFTVELFSEAKRTDDSGSYYERLLSFSNGRRVEFSSWLAPDCSISQTIIFRVRSGSKDELIVGTAAREISASGEVVAQSDPAPQRIRLFVQRTNVTGEEAGKSSVWFDSVREVVTARPLCEAADVRRVIGDFFVRNRAGLGLQ
jgi:hypothetical protein